MQQRIKKKALQQSIRKQQHCSSDMEHTYADVLNSSQTTNLWTDIEVISALVARQRYDTARNKQAADAGALYHIYYNYILEWLVPPRHILYQT